MCGVEHSCHRRVQAQVAGAGCMHHRRDRGEKETPTKHIYAPINETRQIHTPSDGLCGFVAPLCASLSLSISRGAGRTRLVGPERVCTTPHVAG